MQLVVMNGEKKFAQSRAYTCYMENHGMSTNDYALVRCNALEMVHQFEVGEQSPNSDHTPLHMWLHMPIKLKENKMHGMSWSYRVQVLEKNAYAYFSDHVLLQDWGPTV